MIHAKSLPQRLWAEALNCETYIQNKSPHRYVKDKTPYEAWSGLKPEVTHFHIFSSWAWTRIPWQCEGIKTYWYFLGPSHHWAKCPIRGKCLTCTSAATSKNLNSSTCPRWWACACACQLLFRCEFWFKGFIWSRSRVSIVIWRVSASKCRCKVRIEAQVGQDYSSRCRGYCWWSNRY